MRKVILSGMIGNGLEWYDYALYGHFAALLSTLFFPNENAYISLIATFGVFAAGFAMRPLGAILFGWIGDKYGRKTALTTAILMMAFPTAAIGLLPTYAQIGIWAPVLLTLIRLLQGISLGGEFSGSIAFMVEHAPPHKRGLVGSAAVFSLVAGMLLGSVVATIFANAFSQEVFESWGWRIPFLLGLLIGYVGFYIRAHTHESPNFISAKETNELSATPVREAFRDHSLSMLKAIGVYLTVTVPFYVLTVFMNSFLSKILGHSIKEALIINTISMVILMVVIPVSAFLSDKYGRKVVLMCSAGALLVLAYPIFYFTTQEGFLIPLAAQCLFAVLVGSYISCIPALLVELFPTRVRFTGMSISYNMCAALFGGTAPVVATWMIEKTGSNTSVAFYLMACSIISLITLYFYKDTYKDPLS